MAVVVIEACLPMQEQSHRATTRLSSSAMKPEAAQGQLAHEARTNNAVGMQTVSASGASLPAQHCKTPQAALTLASLGRGPLFVCGAEVPVRCSPLLPALEQRLSFLPLLPACVAGTAGTQPTSVQPVQLSFCSAGWSRLVPHATVL